MEVGWDDYLFWLNAQNIFFQLPKLNKFCLGVELDPAHQVIKKLKMDHLWVYTQPRSKGSLLPALFLSRSVGRVGENPGNEVGSTRCIPIHASTATECDKKTKRACQLLKF